MAEERSLASEMDGGEMTKSETHQRQPSTPEELAQASRSVEADRLARNRGEIPWVDTIDQLTAAEHQAEWAARLARMQQVTQEAAQRLRHEETPEPRQGYRYTCGR